MSNAKNFAVKVLRDNGVSNPTKSQINDQKSINSNWSDEASREITRRSSIIESENPSLFNGSPSGWSNDDVFYYED